MRIAMSAVEYIQQSRSYVSELETGVYSASVTMLGRLAAGPGVDPSEFLKP